MNAKPAIVLVHGLWADGSSWQKVISPLVAEGFDVIAVQNSTSTLEEDLAATLVAIERAHGSVILVGHSWGGFVITEAGTHPRVKGLVYVAAFAPDVGETLPTLSAKAAPTHLSDYLEMTNGVLTVSRAGVAAVFAADLPESEQAMIYAVQQPAHPEVFAGIGKEAAWKTKPSWYVVASEDKSINPDLQVFMAERASAKTTVLKADHVAMLSKPQEVLQVILDAATSAAE